MNHPERPPALTGLPAPRTRDRLRLVWWAQRGYLHGARHGTGPGRVFSAILAAAWWPALPILVPLQFALTARRRASYYMSPDRDAVLAIVATAHGWHIEDHTTAHPGTGRGRALRALALPELLSAASAQQIPILTTAATPVLAQRYSTEVPGLIDIGPARPRGRRMHRKPDPLDETSATSNPVRQRTAPVGTMAPTRAASFPNPPQTHAIAATADTPARHRPLAPE